MTTKFQDKIIVDNLRLSTGISADITKTEQFKKFAAFIIQHKQEALTSREIRLDQSIFSQLISIEHTLELNVFTNEELKEFVSGLRLKWIKDLNDLLYLQK